MPCTLPFTVQHRECKSKKYKLDGGPRRHTCIYQSRVISKELVAGSGGVGSAALNHQVIRRRLIVKKRLFHPKQTRKASC